MLTVNGLSDYNPRPCSNCGASDWAAKNDRYCTSCEKEYAEAYRQTICQKPNPIQFLADVIFDNYGKDSSGPWGCHFCGKNDCNEVECWSKKP